MIRRWIISCSLCLCSLSAMASNIYFGPTVAYQSFYINSIRYQSFSPRLTLGYGGWQYDWLYLSAEVFGSPHDYKYNSNPEIDQTLKVKYSFGASIIPGVFLDNMLMAYGRIGGNYAKFSQTNSIHSGVQVGLGLGVTLTPYWLLRGEYDYTKFSKVGTVGSPQSDEFAMSILYQFYPTGD